MWNVGSPPIPESIPLIRREDGSLFIEFGGGDFAVVAEMAREGAGIGDIQQRLPDCPAWVLFEVVGFCLANPGVVDLYLRESRLAPDALPASLPLYRDDQGLIRVTAPGEPYLYEILVNASSPEEVVTLFPEIPRGVACQLIGYYLRHQCHIDFEISEGNGAEPVIRGRSEPPWFPALFPRRPDRHK
jgi:hypothetical protein